MRQAVPSIDLMGEDAVRLRQGREGTRIAYGDPLELAAKYEAAGFPWLHVVDLDAAFGRKSRIAMLFELRRACKRMKIQWAGGVRSAALARQALAAGADRVVFGTALFTEGEEVAAAVGELGAEKVWAALDFSGRPPVARIAGWKEKTGAGLEEALIKAKNSGVGGVIVSSVDADGMQKGPDLGLVAAAARLCSCPFWAAGGMRDAKDAKNAFALGAQGAVFGRALYGKNIDLEELACLREE